MVAETDDGHRDLVRRERALGGCDDAIESLSGLWRAAGDRLPVGKRRGLTPLLDFWTASVNSAGTPVR